MNRPLHDGNFRYQSSVTGGPSRRRRAVPCPRGLVGGITPHFRSYRKGKRPVDNKTARGAGIATGAPQFAHVRTSRGDWQCGTTAGNSRPQAKNPPRPEPGGHWGSRAMLLRQAIRPLAALGFEGLDRIAGLLHRAGHEASHGVRLMPTSA